MEEKKPARQPLRVVILRLPARGQVWSLQGGGQGHTRSRVLTFWLRGFRMGGRVGVSAWFRQEARLLPATALPTRDSELGGTRGLLCRRADLEGTREAMSKTKREDSTDRTARRLGVIDSCPVERDDDDGEKAGAAGRKEKPVEQGEERGSRAGASTRHASLPHAPRGCGSPPETGAATKRPVDYHSQKVVRRYAYDSRQPPRARLSSARCFSGRNYSSHEASREAAWKWAAWKSLGPPELAASLASRAVPDAAVEEPAGRAGGTARCIAFDLHTAFDLDSRET
ncbi:uncharacterized protein LOC127238916 [Phodopus roborovskii]|uniref:uncharacterized protein LOC127238916 n=1 Tax=Phodopus roborovskii TaxID=109678 RepID=UPI0021E3F843|nr:uncharacterized protein LOC127238916 [Phodopus roborovskii]